MVGSYVRKLREAEECGAVPDNSKVPFLRRYRAKRHAPLARSRTEVPVWRAGLALYGGRDTNMDVMMLPTGAHPALYAEPARKNHQGPIGASALRRRKCSHRPCRPHRSSRCRLRRVRAAALETSCGICGATLFWYMAIGSVWFGSVRFVGLANDPRQTALLHRMPTLPSSSEAISRWRRAITSSVSTFRHIEAAGCRLCRTNVPCAVAWHESPGDWVVQGVALP